MDNTILRKKLNTYKSPKGSLKGMSHEVILEVLQAWQNWPGSTADLYRDLGLSKGQMSALIRAGKKLVKNGAVVESEFKEVKVESVPVYDDNCNSPITVKWDRNKVIRFSQVDQLVDFLNKVEKKAA
ncbi:MAG: hypothetical protein H6625_11265 [Bdellovibrionaceae bacterium]|nr:hypothetical protein [Pseudobdellovibrionaceae bacterium]MCB9026769.1 hypothetical protein [Pseudobdellovibrionaceae bacterium]MCB9026890.1 hypothetical protein [Pseudobdellovibrionaceae bacterium]